MFLIVYSNSLVTEHARNKNLGKPGADWPFGHSGVARAASEFHHFGPVCSMYNFKIIIFSSQNKQILKPWKYTKSFIVNIISYYPDFIQSKKCTEIWALTH